MIDSQVSFDSNALYLQILLLDRIEHTGVHDEAEHEKVLNPY